MKFILAVLVFCLVGATMGQCQEMPPQVQDALQRMKATLALPLDSDYKTMYISEEQLLLQPYDYAIRSGKEEVEIRFLFLPSMGNEPHPQVNSYRLALHIGDNEQSTDFTARELTERELKEVFHADWGRVYILKPKAAFSVQQYCRLLCLHKHNQGMICVFYLFDKPSLAIDRRLHLVRYQ